MSSEVAETPPAEIIPAKSEDKLEIEKRMINKQKKRRMRKPRPRKK